MDGISVNLERKSVRRITLKVDPDGRVRVVAPIRAEEATVVTFVRSKIGWVKSVLAKKSDGPYCMLSGNEGDKITVFGDTYTVKHVPGSGKQVVLGGENIVMHLSEKYYERRDKILREWVKRTLEKEIVESLKKWHTLTGLDCSDITLKDMRSRWGSCNVVTKKLCFSLRLISQHKACVDYVVLHELTHTVYKAHDKDFYGFIARFMPDYKAVAKALVMPTNVVLE